MVALREFARGVAMYWRGFRMWSTDPALMALGLLPGFITAVCLVAAFLAMRWWLDPTADWVADRMVGDSAAHGLVQFAATLGILGAGLLIAIYGFVSITSVVGQPFFEHISHTLDDRLGPVAQGPGWPWWRNAARGVGEGLRLSLITVPVSIAVFALGFIPVVGTPIGWTLGALVGGWFVALEFSAVPFERRGLLLRDRRRVLGARRARTVGFGAMAFVMSAFAPIAVIMMPSAVAGGTLLARWALDEAARDAEARALAPPTLPTPPAQPAQASLRVERPLE